MEMEMNLGTLLVFVALGAAVLLFFQSASRTLPVAGLVIAGVELLLHLGIVSLGVRGVQVSLVLGIGLAVVGALAWRQANQKTAVTAATALGLVGVVQVVSAIL